MLASKPSQQLEISIRAPLGIPLNSVKADPALITDLLQELNVSVAKAAAAFGARRSNLRLRTRMAPARSAENNSIAVKASANPKVAQS